PLDVKWSLSPNIGTINAGWNKGSYTYTAPTPVTSATQVTATATDSSNSARTGVAKIEVTPTAVVKVTAAQSSPTPGATVALTAATTAGDISDIRWVVSPATAGTVPPDANTPGKATYTAPKSNKDGQARIVAYLVDDKAAGLGLAVITLSN